MCSYGVNTPSVEKLKPIDDVSLEEWSLLLSKSSNVCGDCLESADWEGIIPDDVPDETPDYECPQCQEIAKYVDLEHVAYVIHGDSSQSGRRGETTHKVPREHYEQWRRNPTEES